MPGWGWITLAYLAAVTIPLAVIDVREHRLPNKLVLPGMALALICAVGEFATSGWVDAMPLLCGVAYLAGMLLLAILGGMGMGDVKLAFVVGAASGFLGWEVALASAFAAFVLGGLVALGDKLWQRIRRRPAKRHIAFGPFMLAAFWLTTTIALVQLS